jgi:polar amino acid transport system substrate-binding protein/cystine transport system substrate-binding protein
MSTPGLFLCESRQLSPCVNRSSKRRAASDGRQIGHIAAILLAVASVATGGTARAASPSDYNTIDPGVMKVAIEPYMPYTAVDNDKLVGLDSDILAAVAQKLGLKLEPKITDFTGMLASVQARRVDISIGGIAWSVARQKVGLFTDPPYYSPPAIAVHGNTTYPDIASLEGKTLGTVTGYVWVKGIQEVPNATARTYPNANGVFEDLAAGRIDVGFLDPLLIIYEQHQRPNMPFKIEYIKAPTAAELAQHPDFKYFQPYMTAFYLPKEEPKLEQAISEQIDAMYQNGELAKLVAKWGGDPKEFLVPSPEMAAARRGVDRSQDWNPPSIGN